MRRKIYKKPSTTARRKFSLWQNEVQVQKVLSGELKRKRKGKTGPYSPEILEQRRYRKIANKFEKLHTRTLIIVAAVDKIRTTETGTGDPQTRWS